MKKRILPLLLALLLTLLFVGCAPAYRADARVGSYIALGADGKTVAYRLSLAENGKGTVTLYPQIGNEQSEEIFFTIDGDTLLLHGTEAVGGVLGRNEYYGTLTLSADKYSVELYAAASGAPLALFVQEPS